jgi:hypothetical protein
VTPGTTLLLTFAGLTFGLTVALWGLGMFLQGYVYSEPAGRMPLRAALGGLILGGFLTFWVYANTRAEGKDRYGTLFEFNPVTTKGFDEFTAVRRYRPAGDKKEAVEKSVTFKRSGGGTTAPFKDADGKDFTLNTADYLVVALELKESDVTATFNADLDDKGKYKPGKVFRDRNRRYIEFGQSNTPSAIHAPSRGAFAGAVLLNLLNFVIWFAVFWPVMRFTAGHAVGLALVVGGVTMLVLMPLLFEKNQVPHHEPTKAEQKH